MTFLRNRWYMAAWSSEVADTPLGRRILGERIVFFRTDAGAAVALSGVCPHRFAPLDRGAVLADQLICPYHGLRFDAVGWCVHNPNGDGHIPRHTRLKDYTIAERHGILWIWLGDEALARETDVPTHAFQSSSNYAAEFIYRRVDSNYELLTDNLLDLTHAPYLHGQSLWSKDAQGSPPQPRFEFSSEGESVHANYYFERVKTPPRIDAMFPEPDGRLTAEMTWVPASILRLDLRYDSLAPDGARPLHLPSLRCLTPETETSTHYFSVAARNRNLADPAEGARIRENNTRAFVDEDNPMVRLCQEMMGTTDLFACRPVILKTDIAAVQARRILAKMIKAEARSKTALDP